jgi:hypothetical protein
MVGARPKATALALPSSVPNSDTVLLAKLSGDTLAREPPALRPVVAASLVASTHDEDDDPNNEEDEEKDDTGNTAGGEPTTLAPTIGSSVDTTSAGAVTTASAKSTCSATGKGQSISASGLYTAFATRVI